MNEIEPGSRAAWVLAMRPRTLPVSIGPVLVGTAVAFVVGNARLGPALVAGLGALSACGVLGAALIVPDGLRRIARTTTYVARPALLR